MTAEPGPTLTTPRLRLRRWRRADLVPFAEMNADPAVMRYFPRLLDRIESDAIVEWTEASFDERGYGVWVVERRSDDAFLGFTGLSLPTFEAAFTPCVEVGWRLRSNAWGHGYATEAGREALRFGFDELRLAEILSWTSATNHPSIRVMERLGMHRDPTGDFDHPGVPVGSPLRPHVLSRLRADETM